MTESIFSEGWNDVMTDNVEGARNLGMQVVHVKSPADITRFIASTDLQTRRVKC